MARKLDRKLARIFSDLERLTAVEIAWEMRRLEIKGKPVNPYECPLAKYVALKLSRHIWDVQVGPTAIEIHSVFGRGTRQDLPQSCRDFVSRFDVAKFPELVS